MTDDDKAARLEAEKAADRVEVEKTLRSCLGRDVSESEIQHVMSMLFYHEDKDA